MMILGGVALVIVVLVFALGVLGEREQERFAVRMHNNADSHGVL